MNTVAVNPKWSIKKGFMVFVILERLLPLNGTVVSTVHVAIDLLEKLQVLMNSVCLIVDMS